MDHDKAMAQAEDAWITKKPAAQEGLSQYTLSLCSSIII